MWMWLSSPCNGWSPLGWQFMQRGCMRTGYTARNAAREAAASTLCSAGTEDGAEWAEGVCWSAIDGSLCFVWQPCVKRNSEPSDRIILVVNLLRLESRRDPQAGKPALR